MSDAEFDPREAIEGAVREVYQRFRVAKPALVRSADRLASRVVAALMTRFVGTDMQAREEPEVPDIPVVHYAGGGYGAWFDMRVDDPAVVVCCDGPVRGFYETGQAVTPRVAQGHDYGSAVAFPGGRTSAVDQPTPPPNAAGEFLVGAADGSAAVVLRGRGLSSLAELGTTIVKGWGGPASTRLGGDDATLGVARLGDPVAASADLATVLTALATAVNLLAPGTVNPATLALALAKIGAISGASTVVVSK